MTGGVSQSWRVLRRYLPGSNWGVVNGTSIWLHQHAAGFAGGQTDRTDRADNFTEFPFPVSPQPCGCCTTQGIFNYGPQYRHTKENLISQTQSPVLASTPSPRPISLEEFHTGYVATNMYVLYRLSTSDAGRANLTRLVLHDWRYYV